MKKILALILIDFLSLFLLATLKPNPNNFRFDRISFITFALDNWYSYLFLMLAIVFFIVTVVKLKRYQELSFGVLLGTYLVLTLGKIDWAYFWTQLFKVYLYGFWLNVIISLIMFYLIWREITKEAVKA
ncbi:hypothetical protein [Pseudolactococcus insecticola]|uniref:Uncharacterized protein n=1 Tax=Pseudolactococcus insecticola TaxID=2709158 RepID=A0A6A0BB79_9LACT|nr:hypothetical protein [Lactococcus insecticola]GFH41067.1 hypothetical protein Hs20B_14650 [Lactococcus insecticola]